MAYNGSTATTTAGTTELSFTISSSSGIASLSGIPSEDSLTPLLQPPHPQKIPSKQTSDSNFSEFDALVKREIRKFRVSYLCSNTFAKCYRYQRMRVPSGKAVVIILLVCFFERLAMFSAMSSMLSTLLEVTSSSVPDPAGRALVQSVVDNIVTQVMFPFAGVIADVWAGRLKVIRVSLWLEFLGFAIIAFSFSFESNNDHIKSVNKYMLLVAFILISMGSAGFQANVIPFGADQMLYKASEELSSYFYWFYWVRNLGALVYLTDYTCDGFSKERKILAFTGVAAVSACIALSINYLFKGTLLIDPERRNPIKMIKDVIIYALTVKRPRFRSAFSFNQEPPPRIDLAKRIHGGKFSSEEVEDVKVFLRLLCLLLAIGGAFIVYTGITSVLRVEVLHLQGKLVEVDITHVCSYSDSAGWSLNVIAILVTIPVLNYLIFPCLREYTPSMVKRIGIGYFFSILAPLMLIVIEVAADHRTNGNEYSCMFLNNGTVADGGEVKLTAWTVLPPGLAMALAEIFIVVSSLEFFYAQSPHSMRGFMIGLFYLVRGLSSVIAAVILVPFGKDSLMQQLIHLGPSCGFWYYLIFLVIAVVTFAVYIFVSKWYKNRQRGDLEESEPFYRQTPAVY